MSNYYDWDIGEIEEIKINLSTPIVMRARCKRCGKFPDTYYCLRHRELIKDVKKQIAHSLRTKKYIKKMNAEWYFDFSPSNFSSINLFSHSTIYKGYNPRLHKTKGLDPHSLKMEYLTCPCNQTIWSWVDKFVQNKLEHKHRRARGYYHTPSLHK